MLAGKFSYRGIVCVIGCNNIVEWGVYFIMTEYLLAYIYYDEAHTHFSDTPTRGISYKSLSVTRSIDNRYPI